MFLHRFIKLSAAIMIVALAAGGSAFALDQHGDSADEDDDFAGPKVPLSGGTLRMRLSDNSVVNLVVRDEKLTFITGFGKLQIPLADIQRLDIGRRVSEDDVKKIAAAIKKLDSDEVDERERAGTELLNYGARAYPELRVAAQSDSGGLEVKLRAAEILDKITARIGRDAPERRPHDIVWSKGSKIIGKVEGESLQVGTLFGDIKVKLADVRSLTIEPHAGRSAKVADAVPDPANLMAYVGQFSTKHAFNVTGQAIGNVWGSEIYTLDSTLAMAAVHAGVVKVGETGTVRVEIVESPPNFAGSTKNGVTTQGWGAFPQGSFKFIAAPIAPAFTPQPGNFAVRFVDGSIFEATVPDDKLTIVTDKGKETVAIADVEHLRLVTRVPDGVAAKAAAAVKNLVSEKAKERQLAAEQLLGLGAQAYPALAAAAKNEDTELGRRARDVIKQLKESLPAEMLEVSEVDVISTKNSRLTGKLETSSLRVRNPFFGDVELRMSDVHSLRSSSFVEPQRKPE